MSYWVFTDIFEEAGPRFEAFHGGFGLMNTQGIRKPAYFAYQFLNALGPTELENGDSQSVATTDGKGNARVLQFTPPGSPCSFQFGTNLRFISNKRSSFGLSYDSAITNPS